MLLKAKATSSGKKASIERTQTATSKPHKKSFVSRMKNQKILQLMFLPGLIWMLIFCYWPMFGLIGAFQEFDPVKGFLGSEFVGLKHFKEMFSDSLFLRSMVNMIGLSLSKIVFAIVMPILFALLLNEIKNTHFKKIVQTASYLPHFISWVVVAGLFTMWLDKSGLINQILMHLNLVERPISYLNETKYFWILMAFIDTWKETGWWAIIYLAAIAGVPQELYESAMVDGAGRIRRIISITLPSIKPTVMTVMTLSIGSMIYGGLSGSNMQQSMLFGNPLNYDVSSILETYVIRMGMNQGRYSYAIAAGLILSVLSMLLYTAANKVSEKISGVSLS